MTAQTRSTVGRGTRVAEALLGIGCAVVGLLPWLLGGMELPLQNLWADDTMIEHMPRVLLPFNQYYVAMLVSLLGFGAALAGLAARRLVARRDRRSALQVIGGMLLVQLIALAQTVAVVQGGLRQGTGSRIYLVGITGIVLLAMLIGLLASVLIALAPAPGALLGLTLGALTVTWWASTLVAAIVGQDALALGVQPLLAPVLVGIAIA